MPITIIGLQSIVKLGGSVSIDATTINPVGLQSLARLASVSGSTLIIRNANSIPALGLQSITKLAPGRVIFEF